MKEIIQLLEFEHKITGIGVPFMRFRSLGGWYSCFDKPIFDELAKLIGKKVSAEVSITTKPNPATGSNITYKNITGYYPEEIVDDTESDMAKSDVIETVKINGKAVTNGKEYHLSIEECRARACECALTLESPRSDQESFKVLRNAFFEWIWKGK